MLWHSTCVCWWLWGANRGVECHWFLVLGCCFDFGSWLYVSVGWLVGLCFWCERVFGLMDCGGRGFCVGGWVYRCVDWCGTVSAGY